MGNFFVCLESLKCTWISFHGFTDLCVCVPVVIKPTMITEDMLQEGYKH